jgi:hypothetical protein
VVGLVPGVVGSPPPLLTAVPAAPPGVLWAATNVVGVKMVRIMRKRARRVKNEGEFERLILLN